MTDDMQAKSKAAARSFYSASVAEFLCDDDNAILGRLSASHVAFHASAEREQLRAWEREICLLKDALRQQNPEAMTWWILLETPLLRLGRRMDAVLLIPGVVVILEFKIGASAHDAAHKVQTERYAQCLRDFHEFSQGCLIIPILCVEHAPSEAQNFQRFGGVSDLILANASTLNSAISLVAEQAQPSAAPADGVTFDLSPYRPTPTIVEAAQALYAGHEIDDIGRGDAADEVLQATATTLRQLAISADLTKGHLICFVTGAPGAGKTLLGLDLALKSRTGARPSVLLSGNRPLVHVLTESLATDAARRCGVTKADAKHEAGAAIQNLLGYLKEHTDGAAPPENVVVFDEAQRAWDSEVGEQLMGRRNSEPELFLEILGRLPWACLICLVGPGQEINRGEGGLRLWGEALAQAANKGTFWKVIAAPQAIDGGPDVAGDGLVAGGDLTALEMKPESRLHLTNSMRAYRNPLHGRWVTELLGGHIAEARRIAADMMCPPAKLTRNLDDARDWLRMRRRGGRTVGLLASSGAVRLAAEGLPPTLRSNELAPIGNWFLKPYSDFRSCGALETPLSEFGVQGLELDFVGICWGGDLIWSNDDWLPRTMSAPKWQTIRSVEKRRYRINSYRVLLTRARAGMIIYVPAGNVEDPSRSPSEFNEIAEALIRSGAEA